MSAPNLLKPTAPADRVRLTRTVRGKSLVVHCHRELQDKGSWVLQTMEQVPEAEGELADGRIIRAGWSYLTLKAVGAELVAHEPDFSRNPEKDLRDDVSVTLRVLGQMMAVVSSAKQRPDFPAFYDPIIAQKGWKSAKELVVARGLRPEVAMSGWLVAIRDMPPTDVEAIPVWKLLTEKPSLLRVLALPRGWEAVYVGDEIVRVQPHPTEGSAG